VGEIVPGNGLGMAGVFVNVLPAGVSGGANPGAGKLQPANRATKASKIRVLRMFLLSLENLDLRIGNWFSM
jgi:hypothetical protein